MIFVIANKMDEIERILLKKLIDNQPLTRVTHFQKPRVNKNKSKHIKRI
jgi:hypothetical protein